MHYDIATDKTTEKEIDITVPATELDRFIKIEINKLRKDLSLKGFRKGKVPESLIRTRYHDTLKAQAMNGLVTESFFKIITENKWRPASQAEMKNLKEDDEIKFRLRFETFPNFELDDYIGIEVFQEEPLPDDFLLEQAIKELREQHANIRETTRPAAVDDFITMDIETFENDKTKENQQNLKVRIGDRNLPDEINKVLVGARKTEKKQVRVDKQTYKIYIKKVEEKILPNIDADFAKVQKFEGIEQLRKKLLKNAKKIEEKRLEDIAKEALSNILLEKNQFEVPNALIESEYRTILQRSNMPDSESNKERFREPAEKRARLDLIINKIADKENIQVKKEETMNLITAMGVKLNDENRESIVSYINNALTKEKTIDFLYKNAKISKKSRIISPKEDINDTRSVRHRANRPG
ncbi:MAG: trigger factor [bacterium]